MLLLMFRSAGDLYAVDARRVVEVIPKVAPRPVPHSPAEFLGLLNYRGHVVPLIDFNVLTGKPPAPGTLNTRIIVAGGRDQQSTGMVGLVAEDVSQVKNVDATRAIAAEMKLASAPYLGEVLRLEEGLVQLIELDRLPTGCVATEVGGTEAPGRG